MNYRVQMSAADITAEDHENVARVLGSGMLSMGSCIEEFERSFAGYVGRRHAIGVNSGTAALHLCMIAAGVDADDEVITTPFSFIASANCIVYQRAKPVFVDIDEESLNIDASLMDSALTNRTKAVLPVHVFGQPCDMDAIVEFGDAHGLAIVEDACEAIGAEYHGRKAGTFGRAAAFGFFPNKQMTTGEGGMIVTDDAEWNELCRSLRNQGRSTEWLGHPRIGFNYRLPELSAALGISQLRRIDSLLEHRADVADRYGRSLSSVAGVTPLRAVRSTTRLSWFCYVLRLEPRIDRDKVMALLQEDGIPSRAYFAPLHLQAPYRKLFGYRQGDFPVTERVAASVLAVPFHARMTDEQIAIVCDGLATAIERARG